MRGVRSGRWRVATAVVFSTLLIASSAVAETAKPMKPQPPKFKRLIVWVLDIFSIPRP